LKIETDKQELCSIKKKYFVIFKSVILKFESFMLLYNKVNFKVSNVSLQKLRSEGRFLQRTIVVLD
jgi:hypothetical protein